MKRSSTKSKSGLNTSFFKGLGLLVMLELLMFYLNKYIIKNEEIYQNCGNNL